MKRYLISTAIALCVTSTVASLHAATLTWDPGNTGNGGTIDPGNGTWDLVGTNIVWNNAGTNVPWTQTNATTPLHAAVFAGADGAYAVDVDAALATQSLTFSNSGYTLSANEARTITNTTGTITVASGKSATIGSNVTVSRGVGQTIITGGGTLNIAGATVNNSGGNVTEISGGATVNVSSGTLFSSSSMVVGAFTTAANGTLNITGGTVTVNSNNFVLGNNTASGTSTSVVTISNGTLTAPLALRFGSNTTSTTVATFNLDGGTVTVGSVARGTPGIGGSITDLFNFNGGTLRPNANNPSFMTGLTRANVRNGGAIFDTNTFNITVAQPLLHSNIGGDAAIDGGLTKNGTGDLTLTGATSDYTGPTTVSQGRLIIQHASGLGDTTSGTTVASGATLAITSGITTNSGESITISGGGADFFGALRAGAGGGTWAGTVNLNATPRLGATAGNTLTITGSIVNGTGNTFAVSGESGTGVVVLNPTTTNTYTGKTDIIRGILRLGKTDALPTGTTLDVDSFPGVTDAATFDMAGFNQTVGALQNSAASNINGLITNSAAATTSTLTVNQTATTTFDGTIANGAGVVALVKSNPGTLTLNGANTYTGSTTVSAGVLVVGNNSALGGTLGATSVASGSRVVLNNGINVTGEAITISGNGNTGGLDTNFWGSLQAASSATATWNGSVTLGSSARVGANTNGSLTLAGVIQNGASNNVEISGAGGVAGTIGGGVVVISGASNTYTGNTNIIRGILRIGANDALPVGTTLDVDSSAASESATFDLNNFNQTVAALQRTDSGGGTGSSFVTNSSGNIRTLTVNQATNTTYSGKMTGNLALTKSGVGNLTLTGVSGANDFAGPTNILAGTLTISGGGNLTGTSAIGIATGAELDTTALAYVMSGSQPFTFDIDGAGAGSAGLLDAGSLNITSGVVSFNVVNPLDDPAYVFANYTSLTGAFFASAPAPAGYFIDYNYLGGNQIALVQIPEPSSLAMLAFGMISLWLFRKRNRMI